MAPSAWWLNRARRERTVVELQSETLACSLPAGVRWRHPGLPSHRGRDLCSAGRQAVSQQEVGLKSPLTPVTPFWRGLIVNAALQTLPTDWRRAENKYCSSVIPKKSCYCMKQRNFLRPIIFMFVCKWKVGNGWPCFIYLVLIFSCCFGGGGVTGWILNSRIENKPKKWERKRMFPVVNWGFIAFFLFKKKNEFIVSMPQEVLPSVAQFKQGSWWFMMHDWTFAMKEVQKYYGWLPFYLGKTKRNKAA